jgi:hypothetical protein
MMNMGWSRDALVNMVKEQLSNPGPAFLSDV